MKWKHSAAVAGVKVGLLSSEGEWSLSDLNSQAMYSRGSVMPENQSPELHNRIPIKLPAGIQ